ncbi:MAG: acylneuraminate cytidylyltransferase [Marinilabiliales bacterium]|nr:acylneuraminate cytidylyltransferase [Marinilabiliales bacterium]
MKKIAFIPLRFGSKGIPNKNIKKILGRPLFTWVLNEAIHSSLDHVFVFTNDARVTDYIKNEYSWTEKLTVLERSEESATETASTDFAMLEFAEKIEFDFDIIMLLQATSPLTTKEDINKACNQIENKKADSVLSVVKTHRFIWSKKGESLNYDYKKRPRRQDFEGLFVENGAIYACTGKSLISNKNRIGGRIELLEMCSDTLVEIDDPTDMVVVDKLLENRLKKNKQNKKIKAFILDVDGVFTNGKVSVSIEGETFKDFSLIDGMGLEILREENIMPIVITSENSPIVTKSEWKN